MQNSDHGSLIEIFLPGGEASGIRVAEIKGWVGRVTVVPRTKLKQLNNRPEGKTAGFYFLVGPDPESPERSMIYVGESENMYDRLSQHNTTKDFWQTAVSVTSKDDLLSKSEIKYLESVSVKTAVLAARASLANSTGSKQPGLSEAMADVMSSFFSQTRQVIEVLGFNFLKPRTIHTTGQSESQNPTFTLAARGAIARAVEVGDEFVVLKGSTAKIQGTPSWKTNQALRDKLVEDGTLTASDTDGYYVFSIDTPFSTPSSAGNIITAQNINGRTAWKLDSDGATYAEWQDSQLDL